MVIDDDDQVVAISQELPSPQRQGLAYPQILRSTNFLEHRHTSVYWKPHSQLVVFHVSSKKRLYGRTDSLRSKQH